MKEKILAGTIALLMVTVMVMPVFGDQPTTMDSNAQVTGSSTAPEIRYAWEVPDAMPGTPGTQVEPIPGGVREVRKYIVVYCASGATNIDYVHETTRYPDGRTTESDATLVPLSEVEAVKDEARDAGLITQDDHDDIDEWIDAGLANIYLEHNYLDCCDPSGLYTVEIIAYTLSGIPSALHTHEFEYLSGIGYTLDFTNIDYGVVDQTGYKEVSGYNIQSICNDPMELCISGTDMVGDQHSDIIPIADLDASLNGESIPSLLETPQCFTTCIGPCESGAMKFSIHTNGLIVDDYTGTLTLAINHC